MKIQFIETVPVQVPIEPSRAVYSGGGRHLESPFLVVRVHTDDGLIGLGEVSGTPGWSGEDHVTAAHVIKTYLEPRLVGADPTEIEKLAGVMRRALIGHPFTKAGVEIALWDLLGKLAGLPLYRLLGGPVRDRVDTIFPVSGREPAVAADIATWAVTQGFRTLKVKVGIDPLADVARVKAVREAVGREVRIGVDANRGWTTRTAIRTIPRLYDFDIIFVEQPVPPDDVRWMAEVRTHVSVPIIADESVFSLHDAMRVVRADAADVLSVYVGKSGGIGQARRIIAVAEAAGLTCTVGNNLELGIGNAAKIHLAMSSAGVGAEEFPCGIISPFFYPEDILTDPLPIQAGFAMPHERPGLGVEVDEEKLERYRVR